MANTNFLAIEQLPLREMNRGLAKPIATLGLEPGEISDRIGIKFEAARDDLDELQAALVRSRSGRQFVLVRHRRQPIPGTDILTNEDSPDVSADLGEALTLLQFGPAELQWTHPDADLSHFQIQQISKRRIAGIRQLIELEERRAGLEEELKTLAGRAVLILRELDKAAANGVSVTEIAVRIGASSKRPTAGLRQPVGMTPGGKKLAPAL